MARSNQFVGLNDRARKLVEEATVEESGETWVGYFDEEFPLNRYALADGRVYLERVQYETCHSGPVVFTALKSEKGNWIPRSLWSKQEIEGE